MTKLIIDFLIEFWEITGQMAPWLLFGFLMAGILYILIPAELVAKHLNKKSIWTVIKAALLGIPLPLCSCGVVPVAASLKKQGAGKGAVTSFLISTPQTGVDSIMATYSMLGLLFTIVRIIAAFFTGLFGGIAVNLFGGDEPENHNGSDDCPGDTCCSSHEHSSSCCADKEAKKELKDGNKLLRILHYGFVTLLGDIAKMLLFGLVLAAIISMVIPESWMKNTFSNQFAAMGAMMLVGIPMYVCSTASIPIAAALMLKGISPGAALVFLITGPATNAASLSAMWKIIGKRSTFIYLGSIVIAAFISGWIMNLVAGNFTMKQQPMHEHTTTEAWIQHVSAAVLLLLMLASFVRRITASIRFKRAAGSRAKTKLMLEINISGMTCSHCQKAAEKALYTLPGAEKVNIDLGSGHAVIIFSGPIPDIKTVNYALEPYDFTCTQV